MLGVGCAGSERYEPATYVVRPRDTLYSIAWRYDLDYRALARWNDIGPDYRITIGQVLRLAPRPGARVAASRTAASEAPRTGEAPRARTGAVVGGGGSTGGASAIGCPQWVWPTQHAAEPRPVAGGGVLLVGELGQPVRAACTGRVVYIGNGLRAYGNLVIIKHGETLLSAYAHNQELLVHEGQEVAAGQDIARMGLGPHQIPALYFEIRVNGKPVDPLPYLSSIK
jgi:lipoprotein NlpD